MKSWHNINGEMFCILDVTGGKVCSSDNYNYMFNKKDGQFKRWGSTEFDDPQFSPIGPEILDLEITSGYCPNNNCKFCYKENSNNKTPVNMSFEEFKNIFNKMKLNLTQIAFGITGVQTNKDFIKMLKYTRKNGVVPNFTLSGIDLTDKLAKEISKYIGGLAVSVYETDKTIGYKTVNIFTSLGIKQTNIHAMISKETLEFVYEILNDIKKEDKLKNLNAIVFLGVKPKGRAKNNFNPLTHEQYKDLISYCFKNEINFGFDSCSAPKFENCISKMDLPKNKKRSFLTMSEPCESCLFSSYVNVHGDFYPCSFTEGEKDWGNGLSVLKCENFLKDIWYNKKVEKFRKTLLNNCRFCPTFKEIN